ncbi:MAG: HAD family hydrolase [Bacteroidota bacterium]
MPSINFIPPSPKKALFLDRDGIINVDTGYVWKPSELVFRAETIPFLQQMREHYVFIIITNQSGVAREMYTVSDVYRFHTHLTLHLKPHEIDILDIFFCPHHPAYGSSCLCRKPSSLMIEKAAAKHGISLTDSWMIGDKITDVDAGRGAGCRTIYLSETPYEKASFSGNSLLAAIPLL